MREEGSFLSRFKYDLMLLGFLLLVVLGAWLNNHPMTFEESDEEGASAMPPSVGAGDVMLITPVSETADTFSQMDFGYAWYSALTQEVGTFLLRSPVQLSVNELSGIRLLIIPSSATSLFTDEQLVLVEQFIRAGGCAIIEMPGPRWRGLTGIGQAMRTSRKLTTITNADASPLQKSFGEHLLETPLFTRMLRLDTIDNAALEGTDVLLEIDSVPAHLHRALGDGHVFILSFDLGMALTALQQGVPREDFAIPALGDLTEDEEDEITHTRPDQLVANDKLRQSLVPYADLLKRHILYSTLRYQPMARLWPFPGTLSGALVMTHEEGEVGDRALYMADYEAERGLTSTYFVSASRISNDGLDRLAADGVELALAWHRSPDHALYQPGGVGRLQPYRSALSLVEQHTRLQDWSGRRLFAARSRGLSWDRDYTQSFRKLVHAGLFIDSSYGPAEPGDYGYLFGTGLPFFPIDRDGLPLPIYEIPFILSDSAGFGDMEKDLLGRLIRESRLGFHQLITLDIDADAMVHTPRASILEHWMRAFELAQQQRHWITSLQEFIRFYDARRRARLSSIFNRAERSLDVRVELPLVQSLSPNRGAAQLPAPAITVPTRYEGGAIVEITVDGQSIDAASKLERSGDGVLSLIPVAPGVHHIRVRYQM